MPKFEVRMKDHDSDDDWHEFAAYDAETAAEKYAEKCADGSGGEMLAREDDDEETVFVRDAAGAITQWSVTTYYRQGFMARQQS